MGQRLNIEVAAGKEQPLIYANCYYHWSAYTTSALLTAKAVIDNYYKIRDEYKDDITLLAAKMFEIPDQTIIHHDDGTWEWGEVMAGLCESSMNVMKFLYPGHQFHPATDRNVGLISITPVDIDNTRKWEEGRLYIDISSEVFSLNIWWECDKEEFKEWFDKLSRDELERIPVIPDDLVSSLQGYFKFDDMDRFIDLVKASPYYRYKNDEGNWVYIIWTE